MYEYNNIANEMVFNVWTVVFLFTSINNEINLWWNFFSLAKFFLMRILTRKKESSTIKGQPVYFRSIWAEKFAFFPHSQSTLQLLRIIARREKKNKNSLTWQSWTRLNVQIVILSISIVSSWTHASKSFDRSILMMLFQIFVVWRQTLDSCKYLDQWHFWSEFPLGTFFSLSLSHSLI